MAPLVQLNNVGISRAQRWLVRNIDLTIQSGQIITLIGPNGSGKSTTAKMVLGILKPDEGKVVRSPHLKVGYVPQAIKMDWTMPLQVDRFMQLTGHIDRKTLMGALGQTGIEHLAHHEMQYLSGGEMQRVMIARAIARKPDLLVLDEPVQGVDFPSQAELYQLIVEVRNTLDCGVLLISHDLNIVMEASDQVLCLNGHICCSGSPTAVAGSAAYQQLFGPSTVSGLALYRHQHDHTHLPDGRVQLADGSIADHCPRDEGPRGEATPRPQTSADHKQEQDGRHV